MFAVIKTDMAFKYKSQNFVVGKTCIEGICFTQK